MLLTARSVPGTPSRAGVTAAASPTQVDRGAYGVRVRHVEVGLDLVVGLHPGRHAEGARVGGDEFLPPVERHADHQRVRVVEPDDEAVVDVPRRSRRCPSASRAAMMPA